jgi:ATP-dependent helicase HrpB
MPTRDIEGELRAYPVFPYLDRLVAALKGGDLLLRAEPGAGKTTLFPWRLLSGREFPDGKIIMLQPRRLAARSAADRIACLLGEKTGKSVGLRTRTETVTSPSARLEVVTDGVMVRMLQNDPSLGGISAVLFDEFHLRSLYGDLAFALVRQTRALFRPDLKVALLSATLPAEEILSRFPEFTLEDVPGRSFPVTVRYRPPLNGEHLAAGAARLALEALSETGGDVLAFLPGFREMQRAREILVAGGADPGRVELLHGSQPPDVQRRVLDPLLAGTGRIILSTNVAETSLTIPGVMAVADTGYERRVRYRPRTGMDQRETVMISQSSAEQRKGRAGRTAPGLCLRWWGESVVRDPSPPPEIAEADLAPLRLEAALWGVPELDSLDWITLPPSGAAAQATRVLLLLGLLDSGGRITPLGRRAAGLGLHPRLAAMVLSAPERLRPTALLMALLLEDSSGAGTRSGDFRELLAEASTGITSGRTAVDYRKLAARLGPSSGPFVSGPVFPEQAGRLLLPAWPERCAVRIALNERGDGSTWKMADGQTAELKGGLYREEALAVASVEQTETGTRRILLAAPVDLKALERGELLPLAEETIHQWDGWKLKGKRRQLIGRIVMKESPAGPEAIDTAAAVLFRLSAEGAGCLPWNPASLRFAARARSVARVAGEGWPGFLSADLQASAGDWLVPWCRRAGEILDGEILLNALRERLTWPQRQLLEKEAPENLVLPSGSVRRIDYESGDIPVLSARLQEFFGLAETPRVGGDPLLLDLLSPAGRTVQKTRDLAGFWKNSYFDVKKDLAGRYPRHYWPDNPLDAEPTARAKPKKNPV